MKLALLFLALALPSAWAQPPVLAGHWLFYKKVYQGKEIPEPASATLRMHFEFSPNGDSALYWWHEGDTDHCARKGRYRVEGNLLVDQVVWVDPKNSFDCSYDPDMQPNKRTRTPFYFRGSDLALRFMLGDEPLDLVWKKIDQEAK